jgi:hypothetical protein
MVSTSAYSQEETDYLEIVKTESQLNLLFMQLYDLDDQLDKDHIFMLIDTLFEFALNQPGSFNYAWNKLDMIGKLKSDDGKIKVISWMYLKNRDDYMYTSYMQVSKGKGKSEIFKLGSSSAAHIKSEDYNQKIDDWHAKIYYQIVTSKYKRKTFYTLLGVDFNNSISTMKTIEVLAIQRGKPVFRGAQFFHAGEVKNRIVFEFSAELSMTLRYNPNLEQIVFDHLTPLHPLYSGSYQFYGPDGSYDGLQFIEGIWVYEEDVDARNINF